MPLSHDVFLPILAHELTQDFYALDPRSDNGKMLLFGLQVLNHLSNGAELNSKLTEEEQIKELLQGYRILYCPDASRITRRLRISKGQSEEEHDYKLIALKKIGEGAFAEVYRVFDPVLQKEVACKVLFDKSYFMGKYGSEGIEYLQRFKREVRILKDEINHPSIIELYKIKLENDPVLFTMPLAENSLNEWLEANQDTSEEVRISIFKDILSGVAYLHDCKISHRDLAPHNILLFKNMDGVLSAKVSDFGLAKDHRSLSAITGLSVSGYGREAFTAPEQMKSLKNADQLSDIYSLGALLYYLITGESPERRFTKLINYQLIVGKAMEEDRSKRYQTVSELTDDLNWITKRSFNIADHMFYSLKTNEGKGLGDITYVLNCISSVQVEPEDDIREKFIKPLISIPLEILKECVRYETIMLPFMHITRENISKAKDCAEEEWNQTSLRIIEVFRGSQNLVLQIDAIFILMVISLKMNNKLAQLILREIMGSLVSFSRISVHVSQLIEKYFFAYYELLISILKDIQYPTDIRDVLNDY